MNRPSGKEPSTLTQQVRQLGDVGCDAPGRQSLARRSMFLFYSKSIVPLPLSLGGAGPVD
jgi:hypothetical protein